MLACKFGGVFDSSNWHIKGQVGILCSSEEGSGLEMERGGQGPVEGIYSHENIWDLLGEKRKGPRTDS